MLVLSYPGWQIRGRKPRLRSRFLLVKESQSSAQPAVLPSCVSPPQEKDHKSNQQPAETEFKVAQGINGKNEHECFGEVNPGLSQLPRRGQGRIVGCARR